MLGLRWDSATNTTIASAASGGSGYCAAGLVGVEMGRWGWVCATMVWNH